MQGRAVQRAEALSDELESNAVGVGEVERDVALDLGGHARLLQPGPGGVPVRLVHRDGEVVKAAQHFGVGTEVEAGEVEESQAVVVADVEEEVGRALVVAILEELDQGEAQELLVEADRALHVRAKQRHVVYPACGGGRASPRLPQVAGAQGLPFGLPAFRLQRHRPRSQAALAPMIFERASSLRPAAARAAAAIGSATPSACGQSLPSM